MILKGWSAILNTDLKKKKKVIYEFCDEELRYLVFKMAIHVVLF